jgi:hypothetical protein
MSRAFKITLAILLMAVAVGAIYLRGLHRQILRLAQVERSEEQARREITRPAVNAPAGRKFKTMIFWASLSSPGTLEPIEVELPLVDEPAERARLALDTLIASPPDPEQRTLPADTLLLEFYLLPDGTAIADFSDALSNKTPSGISSEMLAVDSIARTVHAAVPAAQRLKILVQGQEAETLAGHVDLGGSFDLAETQESQPPPKTGATASLTPGTTPGTLKPPPGKQP